MRSGAIMISILLVDDHPAVRNGLKTRLDGEMDLEVTQAVGSGEEALELLEERRPDLLITDLSMGPVDGIELTRRAIKQWPDLPVLVVSRHE
jgi:DNA-binding NarL/FixJ family response regulator